jgi:hypothetical protein
VDPDPPIIRRSLRRDLLDTLGAAVTSRSFDNKVSDQFTGMCDLSSLPQRDKELLRPGYAKDWLT